ncbi:hypothetical protein HDU87_001227 [Geranomyces variabilis]|uniref:Peptide chain release factor domain-containing protein n=1 Tax=Geranomyces variabilis TaxID=109894 RepID=A0AAD5XLY1_9FUNG|nr:hypothetical protein HDU87_001227 [Geranomyces variabilis]
MLRPACQRAKPLPTCRSRLSWAHAVKCHARRAYAAPVQRKPATVPAFNPATRLVPSSSSFLCRRPVCQRQKSTTSNTSAGSSDTLESIAEDKSEVTRLLALVAGRNPWSALEDERTALRAIVSSDTLWEENAAKAIESQKRFSHLDDVLNEHNGFVAKNAEIREMLLLAQEDEDDDAGALLEELAGELATLRAELERYSLRLMMSEEADKSGCFIEFRAGAGGAEACDWVQIILRMYERWGTSPAQGFTEVRVVDEVRGDVAGLKAATIQIVGDYAYGWCKHETGVHRFVRQSPFDSSNRRHTSFVSVQVTPALDASGGPEGAKYIDIPAGDIKLEAMKAQGAGGQHVNTTESAVRITHLPTGIAVACQSQRSQHQNRAVAMQMLQSKLYERELRAKAQAKAEQHAELDNAAWGSQIRSYVMHPYKMIKDLRTGFERSDVDRVLDGDLGGFMEAALVKLGKPDS